LLKLEELDALIFRASEISAQFATRSSYAVSDGVLYQTLVFANVEAMWSHHSFYNYGEPLQLFTKFMANHSAGIETITGVVEGNGVRRDDPRLSPVYKPLMDRLTIVTPQYGFTSASAFAPATQVLMDIAHDKRLLRHSIFRIKSGSNIDAVHQLAAEASFRLEAPGVNRYNISIGDKYIYETMEYADVESFYQLANLLADPNHPNSKLLAKFLELVDVPTLQFTYEGAAIDLSKIPDSVLPFMEKAKRVVSQYGYVRN